MKEERLQKLLERYYNGDSSPAEEEELRQYFSAHQDEGYEAEHSIFSYYDSLSKIPMPGEDFEEKLISVVEKSARPVLIRTRFIAILSAAASVLVIAGLLFFLNNRKSEDTYKDPHMAYIETLKILNEISVKMNGGTRKLQPVMKIRSFEEQSLRLVGTSFGKAEKQLDNLKRSINITQSNN